MKKTVSILLFALMLFSSVATAAEMDELTLATSFIQYLKDWDSNVAEEYESMRSVMVNENTQVEDIVYTLGLVSDEVENIGLEHERMSIFVKEQLKQNSELGTILQGAFHEMSLVYKLRVEMYRGFIEDYKNGETVSLNAIRDEEISTRLQKIESALKQAIELIGAL